MCVISSVLKSKYVIFFMKCKKTNMQNCMVVRRADFYGGHYDDDTDFPDGSTSPSTSLSLKVKFTMSFAASVGAMAVDWTFS